VEQKHGLFAPIEGGGKRKNLKGGEGKPGKREPLTLGKIRTLPKRLCRKRRKYGEAPGGSFHGNIKGKLREKTTIWKS